MLGIKIRDTFISLYDDTQLSFELSHPIGLIVDGVDSISGGYTLPVDIPLDETNRALVGHVDRLDLHAVLMQDEYCEVWADGLPFMIGEATMKKVATGRASLFIIFNEINALKSVDLSAIDLGGDRGIGEDTATRLAHAKDTATDPLDYDYVFCPVLNPIFPVDPTDLNPTITGSHLQNHWNTDTDEFMEFVTGHATPFIRLDYLLNQVFAHMGYTLDNQWQTTDELKLLLLYNNRSIYKDQDTWDSIINLKNHVPYRTTIELIKATIGTFALGIYFDPHERRVEIIPFRDLILAPHEWDWTSKAAQQIEYVTDRNYVAIWRYGLDESDDLSIKYSVTDFPLPLVNGEGLTINDILDLPLVLITIYYALADNTYYDVLSSSAAVYAGQDFRSVIKEGSDIEYISPLIPLWSSYNLGLDGYIDNDLEIQPWLVPHIRQLGYSMHYPWMRTPQTAFRTMLYRGFQPFDEGIDGTYPMAGVTAYNIRGELVGDHSLLWDREHGIYEKFWKLPYTMLRDKKEVTRDLNLTIGDFLNFRFKHKIRIENQNYFITRLRFTLTMRGMSVTTATMITTL